MEKDQADFSCGTARIVDAEKPVALVYPKVEFFMFFTPFCHQTVFMRKDVFFKEYGFNVGKYKIIADHDLITRMILKGYKLSIVDDILVSYRLGGFSNQLSNETMMLQKEYFSKLIEVNSNAREYKLNVNELKRLSSTVCDNVKKALSHLHYEKTKKKSIRVVIKRYFYPIIKIYKILRVPLFSIEKLNVPIYSLRKTYRFLSVKLFEKKMTPTEEQYRILYIPILTIKHLE